MSGDLDIQDRIRDLLVTGQNWAGIKESLMAAGYSSADVDTVIDRIKAEMIARQRKRGITLGIAGGVLLVLGFLLTVCFYHTGISFDIVMYSTTILGALLLLMAMICLMGW